MSTTELWWITLGVGLVVAIVAWALLHVLYRAVMRIERNLGATWDTATGVAANTATTWMLAGSPRAVSNLAEEAVAHDRFLSGGSP